MGPVAASLRRPRGLLAVAGLGLAVAAAACSGPRGTPEVRFSNALEALFEDPFSFEVRIEADRASLNDLGEGAQAAADFLLGLRIRGAVDENEAAGLDVSAFGIDDLAQFLVLGTDGLYLRASLDEFAVAADSPPLDVAGLVARLGAAGVEQPVIDAARALANGDWIGLTGLQDVEPTDDGTGAAAFDLDEAAAAIRDAFGPNLQTFVTTFLTLEETTDGDETRWDVTLDLAGLVAASQSLNQQLGLGDAVPTADIDELLGGLPANVPGVVIVRNGVLSEITFDVADAASAEGNDVSGSIIVRIAFDDDPPPISPPDEAVVVTLDQVSDAVTRYVTWQAQESLRQLQESLSELATEPASS